MTGVAARDIAKGMLEKVGITAADQRLNQYPHQLSGDASTGHDRNDSIM